MLPRWIVALLLATAVAKATPLQDAIKLYNEGHYAEAERQLDILMIEDQSGEVAYYLGMSYNGEHQYEHAISWLERATVLEPDNARYLSDYAGAALQQADRTNSYSLATKGRDAMKRAIALEPTDLDARDGLMQFYAKAPWPLGDKDLAREQAAYIARADPIRGLAAEAFLAIEEKRYPDAIAACRKALAKQPDDYEVLYQLGRVANFDESVRELGIAALRKCLTIVPPPSQPDHAAVHYRLGTLLEKTKDFAGAKAEYRAALTEDPTTRAAARALEKLPE